MTAKPPSHGKAKAKRPRVDRNSGFCPRCRLNRRFQGGVCPPCRAQLARVGLTFHQERQGNRQLADQRRRAAAMERVCFELLAYEERHAIKDKLGTP